MTLLAPAQPLSGPQSVSPQGDGGRRAAAGDGEFGAMFDAMAEKGGPGRAARRADGPAVGPTDGTADGTADAPAEQPAGPAALTDPATALADRPPDLPPDLAPDLAPDLLPDLLPAGTAVLPGPAALPVLAGTAGAAAGDTLATPAAAGNGPAAAALPAAPLPGRSGDLPDARPPMPGSGQPGDASAAALAAPLAAPPAAAAVATDPRSATPPPAAALQLSARDGRAAAPTLSDPATAAADPIAAALAGDAPLPGSFADDTALLHQPAEARRTSAGAESAGPLHRSAPDGPPPAERQIVTAILSSGTGRTDILLDPQDLGRVRLALEGNETGIVVTITADRSETADLLRRNTDLLLQEFREAGYTDIAFSFADRGQTADPPERQDDSPGATEAEPATAPPPLPSHPGPRGSALLDLRL
jgi:flagellar hook-length control protein FliK